MKKKKVPKIKKKTKHNQTKKSRKTTRHKVSEQEFIEVWEKISQKLGYKFKFGYHSFDDMKQQAAIFALEGLKNYDHKRPLENFLWTHVRNRLFNYKRDNYQRPDKPCFTCPFYQPKQNHKCSEFNNLNDCNLYASWIKRNDAKKNIVQPCSIENIQPNKEPYKNSIISLENKELIKMIDENISIKNRPIFLKLLGGSKVPRHEINKLAIEIQEIINNNG